MQEFSHDYSNNEGCCLYCEKEEKRDGCLCLKCKCKKCYYYLNLGNKGICELKDIIIKEKREEKSIVIPFDFQNNKIKVETVKPMDWLNQEVNKMEVKNDTNR
jgi:hypothetical protein